MTNKKQLNLIAAVLTAPSILIVWEILSRAFLNESLLPPPSFVFLALVQMAKSGELMTDVSASLLRAIAGFAIGTVFGIICGVLTARFAIIKKTLGQFIEILRPVPAIAFLPLFILWLGIGEISKVLIIAYGCFFPIWINAHAGISNVEKSYVWAAKSLGATNKALLTEIILPYATPFILTGLRVSIGTAFILLIVAEMTGAFAGIGYRISVSHLVFRADKMLAGIVTLGILGALVHKSFVIAANRVIPWYETK